MMTGRITNTRYRLMLEKIAKEMRKKEVKPPPKVNNEQTSKKD